jgi:hypothetical protein
MLPTFDTPAPANTTPRRYIMRTQVGTDSSMFAAYVKSLSDKGEDLLDIYRYPPRQTYVTNLTAEQAREVAQQPFIKFVIPDAEVEDGMPEC